MIQELEVIKGSGFVAGTHDLEHIRNHASSAASAAQTIMDTDLPAVKVDTADIRSDVTTIHDTDLPAVVTDIFALKGGDYVQNLHNLYKIYIRLTAAKDVIEDIHDTDLPAVKTDTGSILSDTGAIRTTDLPAARDEIADVDTTVNEIKVISYATASDDLLHSNDAEKSGTHAVYTKAKEILCMHSGTYRVEYSIKLNFGSDDARGKVYKNGVAHGTETMGNGINWVFRSEDLVFERGDLIQLYYYDISGTHTVYCKEFRLKGVINTDFVNIMV